ncbi:MAG: hypothetical protein ABI981_02755 [Betaproteobacteria bacterium]
MEKCVNCQFYDRRNARPNDGRAPVMWGQCRRHSPHLSPVAGKKAYLVEGVWPLVRDDDWCGEWRAPARSTIGRTRFGVRPAEAVPANSPSQTDPVDMPVAASGD